MKADAIMKGWAKMLNCDVGELGDGEFFFDQFETPEALDKAWSLIPEHRAIRERVAMIQQACPTAEELGGVPMYFVPRADKNAGVDSFQKLVEDYLQALIPLAERAGGQEMIERLRKQPKLTDKALADAPKDSKLERELYSLHTEPILDHLPNSAPYYILKNYAVYLTKDDRVTAFVLFPCLKKAGHLETAYRLGFEIWRQSVYFWSDEKDKCIRAAKKPPHSPSFVLG